MTDDDFEAVKRIALARVRPALATPSPADRSVAIYGACREAESEIECAGLGVWSVSVEVCEGKTEIVLVPPPPDWRVSALAATMGRWVDDHPEWIAPDEPTRYPPDAKPAPEKPQ